MSKSCEICGRGTQTSFHVSHSKVKAKRTQKVNIQTKKVDGMKLKVCTKCIKTATKA